MLPKELRDRVWRAYRPGQEIDKRPSAVYLRVASEVEEWAKNRQRETDRDKTAGIVQEELAFDA